MANLALNHPTEGLLDTDTLALNSYSVIYVNATGSGTGSGGVSQLYQGIRSASANGGATAGDTATRVIVKVRSASDTSATGGSATVHLAATFLALDHPTLGTLNNHILTTVSFRVLFQTVTGSGTGTETATRVIIGFRNATGSGLGTETATGNRIVIRSASDTNGTGGSASVDLAAKPLFLDETDGTGRLDFNFVTGFVFSRLKRTGADTGTGSGSTASFTTRFRSASDTNGTGGSATVSIFFKVFARTATGSGTGGESVTTLVIRPRTATDTGTGSGSTVSFTIRFRSGTASAGTGGYATTPWDILDVVESTNFVVEIELTTTPFLQTSALTLDSATTGLLNTNTLGARQYYDVTQYVKEINISRGRSRQLDSFNAGTASVVFNDPTRQFDPTNTLSNYYGGIIPRQPIRISANGIRLFTGYIEDWNLDYTQPTMLTTSIQCVDGFSLLSTILLEEYAATNAERSDQRITTVLALPEVSTAAPTTSLEVGTVTLMDDLINDNTVLLDYLQEINRAEQGYLFMTASDTLKFIARGAASSLAITTGSIPVFTDTVNIETDFKYLELGIQFGTELLFNRVTVQNTDSAIIQTVNDTDSQIDYLIRAIDFTGLILETDAQALALGNYILAQYARPLFRYDSVSISASGITNNRKNRLFAIELAQLVKTTRNFSVGSPTEVTRYSLIEGIQHQISLNSHVVRYSLNTLSYTP